MTLAVVFTRKISLKYWENIGSIEREIKPYIEMSKKFEKIFFFTYGDFSDLEYKRLLPENIEIIVKPKMISCSLYVFLMPLIHRKIFNQIDIIKTNQMDGSWSGVIAKKLFGSKLVVRSGYEWLNFLITTGASYWKKFIARIVEKVAYKNADKIIITSIEDKNFIENNFNISETIISIIRNYIDTEKFKPQDGEKEERSVVFVGRLENDKNLNTLARSLVGLNTKLYLVGAGSRSETIRQTALDLGVTVNFLGKISQADLPKILSNKSIFVLPSKSEGNPKALLEAMSCGLPCIGTNVKGIKEVIDDGETGLLAELNPEDLRQKIITLLENKELRDRLGRNAREKIIANQSLDIIVEKELKLYESIL